MPHNRKILLPVGTVVQLIKTHEFARITRVACLMDNPSNFLHYLAEIEDRAGEYALYPENFEVEWIPPTQ